MQFEFYSWLLSFITFLYIPCVYVLYFLEYAFYALYVFGTYTALLKVYDWCLIFSQVTRVGVSVIVHKNV